LSRRGCATMTYNLPSRDCMTDKMCDIFDGTEVLTEERALPRCWGAGFVSFPEIFASE